MMSDLRDLYQEVILDHSKHPRNFGRPDHANCEARGDNPLCGDKVTVYLRLEDGVVRDVGFEGRGCAISMASASMMTEILKGRSQSEAHSLFERFHAMLTAASPDRPLENGDEAFDKLEVLVGVREFPMRVKCATLPWHTFEAAVTGAAKVSTE